MARTSIEIESFKHANPIPAATRIGPLVVSSITPPTNPGSRDVPDSLEEQIDNLFTHVGQMLEGAGATWGDMAKSDVLRHRPGRVTAGAERTVAGALPRPGVAAVSPQHEGGRQRAGADLVHIRGLRRRLSHAICACSATGLLRVGCTQKRPGRYPRPQGSIICGHTHLCI